MTPESMTFEKAPMRVIPSLGALATSAIPATPSAFTIFQRIDGFSWTGRPVAGSMSASVGVEKKLRILLGMLSANAFTLAGSLSTQAVIFVGNSRREVVAPRIWSRNLSSMKSLNAPRSSGTLVKTL